MLAALITHSPDPESRKPATKWLPAGWRCIWSAVAVGAERRGGVDWEVRGGASGRRGEADGAERTGCGSAAGGLAGWGSGSVGAGVSGRLLAGFRLSRSGDNEMPEPARQPTSQHDDLLTAEEVAALLRVTPAWVYAQTRRHRIPHIRLGRYVRYRRDALGVWMDQLER